MIPAGPVLGKEYHIHFIKILIIAPIVDQIKFLHAIEKPKRCEVIKKNTSSFMI